jgi:hypothetical protein
MRRPSLATAAWLLLPSLTGCVFYPETPVFAYGQALHADGSPLSDLTLSLESTPRTYSAAADEEGLSPPPVFSLYGDTRTGQDGKFILELRAGDLELDFSSAEERRPSYHFRLATPLEQGRSVFVSFEAEAGGDIELPLMRIWDANLSLEESATGRALAFAPLPPTPTPPLSARVPFNEEEDPERPGEILRIPTPPTPPRPVIQIHTPGGLLWQAEGPQASRALPPHLLEDFTGLEAQVRVVSAGRYYFSPLLAAEIPMNFRIEWRSERLALPPGSLRPISRGAACYPAAEGTCPWTDGQLTPVRLPPPAEGEPLPPTGITLPAPANISRIVIRGLETYAETLQLEASEDGVTWTQVATVSMPDRTLRHPGSTQEDIYFQGIRDDLQLSASPFDPSLDMGSAARRASVFLDVPLPAAVRLRHLRVSGLWEPVGTVGVKALAELSLFE